MTQTTTATPTAQADTPTVGGIAEGDRVYATEAVSYSMSHVSDTVPAGGEGTVIELTGHDCCDLLIEWDLGIMGVVNSGSVALVRS